ncbi:MAG TPA: DUF5056 domain-containing protein [Bacteroidales bacterium]|nr:DUF5056 domain-containing protein [Bacteroidales bacterium]
MKEDNIKVFFTKHKETVPDDGFNARLLNTLIVLPQPRPRKDRKPLIVSIFAAIGTVLFVVFGGYDILLQGLETVGLIFSGSGTITPEIITTMLMTILAFWALIRFALRSFEH